MCQELLWVARPAAPERFPPPSVSCAAPPPSPLAVVPAALSTLVRRQNLCQPVAFFLRAVLSRGCSAQAAWPGATSLRQEVTGDTPSWWAGGGGSGPPAAATPVAGATNVAPPLVGSRSRRDDIAAFDWDEVRRARQLGFVAQPPDRVYSRDSTNQTHVGVPGIAKIKMTTYV